MYSLLIQANGTSGNTKKNSLKIRKIIRKTGFPEVKSPFPTMSRTLFVVRRRDGVGWQLVCCWCFPFLTRSTLADILLIHSVKWKQACRDRKTKLYNDCMFEIGEMKILDNNLQKNYKTLPEAQRTQGIASKTWVISPAK